MVPSYVSFGEAPFSLAHEALLVDAALGHEVAEAWSGEWRRLARCRDRDPDVFFPGRGMSTAPAKAICASCPVRAECLEYALENREKYGIWGGKSERERRQLRRLRTQRQRRPSSRPRRAGPSGPAVP
ncbi:MAG: WhiB family transcriptional regulator [Acidimicrobiia bacterium]|nr:WhiB family transcriptional regulator [Acidimicrobiia bacterium]